MTLRKLGQTTWCSAGSWFILVILRWYFGNTTKRRVTECFSVKLQDETTTYNELKLKSWHQKPKTARLGTFMSDLKLNAAHSSPPTAPSPNPAALCPVSTPLCFPRNTHQQNGQPSVCLHRTTNWADDPPVPPPGVKHFRNWTVCKHNEGCFRQSVGTTNGRKCLH